MTLVILAGCGGSSGPPGVTNKTGHYIIDVNITGSVAGSTHFEKARPCVDCGIVPDCAALAKGNKGNYGIPGSADKGSKALINGVDFGGGASIRNYKGPGTYPTATFADQSLTMTVDKQSEQEPFQPDPTHGSSMTATINADGSGKFEMAGWMDAGSRTVGGTITWTCKDS